MRTMVWCRVTRYLEGNGLITEKIPSRHYITFLFLPFWDILWYGDLYLLSWSGHCSGLGFVFRYEREYASLHESGVRSSLFVLATWTERKAKANWAELYGVLWASLLLFLCLLVGTGVWVNFMISLHICHNSRLWSICSQVDSSKNIFCILCFLQGCGAY